MSIRQRTYPRMSMAVALAAIALTACHAVAQAPPPDETSITLSRSACFGSCPDYTVIIHGDGRVRFTTQAAPVPGAPEVHRKFRPSPGVLMPGTHDYTIPSERVKTLLTQFQKAGFWRLRDRYVARVTDNPTKVVTLVMGGRRKQVTDYVGQEVGMPASVTLLEDAVDDAAETARWVSGTMTLVAWLDQQGFDFHSDAASELAVAAENGRAEEALVVALIDRGAKLGWPVEQVSFMGEPMGEPEPAGLLLLRGAIRRGHVQVFQRLVSAGWVDRWGAAEVAAAFAVQGAGCSPALVDAMAHAGIDIDTSVAGESNARPRATGPTALGNLATGYVCHGDEAALVETAKHLMANGANPNHIDSLGHTALYGVENMALLDVLLASGANASIKSTAGESVVFGTWNDAIVLKLLKAGASATGVYDDGRTLVQQDKVHAMPQSLKWLAQHPEAYAR